MATYNFRKIEKKWQEVWKKKGFYRAEDFDKKPKKYILIEFPYPSGDGLHVGHVRSYSALDAVVRKKRMEGFNVLYPIGWDAFGLPTENYAIKKGVHPAVVTKRNIAVFKKQLKSLGLSFDWSREINTTDPHYYKWTQWIFLQFFKKGLAYQKEMPINWCPKCKIGLANEEVVAGKCERCGAETTRKKIKQWMLEITKYADRLIDDLNNVDYLEKIKTQQINWIGRSEGTQIEFKIQTSTPTPEGVGAPTPSTAPSGSVGVNVFTTRIDTIFGVTALVVAPEHEIISNLKFLSADATRPHRIRESVSGEAHQALQAVQISNLREIEDYIKEAEKRGEIERTKEEKEKTGVKLEGITVINPVNGEEVPVFVGDYVVATYGGGAVMVVPAHDKRDYKFAKKFGLEIREAVAPNLETPFPIGNGVSKLEEAFVEDGILVNSGQFSGLTSEKAREEITKWLAQKGAGKKMIQYKLRDWIFSRQHYWGEPIPIIHCDKCGAVPVPEKDLPVKLPYVKKYKPTQTGESPLAAIKNWVNVKCPKCDREAKRETDTMPNWAGSSWYYLAYLMREISNFQFPISKYRKAFKYWLPVDLYNGGMEHTTLHLLYSRFWHKFLYDLKLVPTSEPYASRRSHGMVLAEDGRKMSKSFGNVINPDTIVQNFGADTLRMYEMFMGPHEQAIKWSNQGVVGVFRFLNRVWNLQKKVKEVRGKDRPWDFKKDGLCHECEAILHKSIKKISEDLENMKFNTAVSQLMILVNEMEKEPVIGVDIYKTFLKLLAPFGPHLAEELWFQLGEKKSIHQEQWPQYDSQKIKEENFELVIQVNGKVRAIVLVPTSITEEEAKELALSQERIKTFLGDKTPAKIIFIPKKLINIVI